MKTPFQSFSVAAALVVLAHGIASAQAPVKPSRPQPTVSSESVERKYTFFVFHKQNDATTQAMAAAVKAEIAKHQEVATAKFVQVDVTVTPLPSLIAIAVGSALLVTTVAALWPARTAAKLDPCLCFQDV